MNEQQQKAMSIVAEVAGRPVAEVSPQMDLVADLGIDSPRALQLLVELEERLGIEINDEEAARMDSVADVLAFLASPA